MIHRFSFKNEEENILIDIFEFLTVASSVNGLVIVSDIQ